jgi:hypothetical protein
MPQILRRNLPPKLFQHLLDRVEQREITRAQLIAFALWIDSGTEVPLGAWFKRFEGMTVCGEGELVKTFLTRDQSPVGTELL